MKNKKTYILLISIIPIFLVGCSIKSLIPHDDINNTGKIIQRPVNMDETNLDKKDLDTKINQTTLVKTQQKQLGTKTNNLKINKKTRIYKNKAEQFSLEFLSGRTFEENKYGFNVIIFTPKDDNIKENVGISVQHLQKFISVQEYYEETTNKLQSTLKEFKEIDSKNITQDNLKGKTVTYRYTEGTKVLQSQQTFLMSNKNIVYIINYTATMETFDNFLDGLNIIIKSFHLLK